MTNSLAQLIKEFGGSTYQVYHNTSSSQLLHASNQSSSQLQKPVNEMREDFSHQGQDQHNQQGKRNKTVTKGRPEKLVTGYGCYVNEKIGQVILNVSPLFFILFG